MNLQLLVIPFSIHRSYADDHCGGRSGMIVMFLVVVIVIVVRVMVMVISDSGDGDGDGDG